MTQNSNLSCNIRPIWWLFLELSCSEMVHDALIHLHKKKAAGEQQQVRPAPNQDQTAPAQASAESLKSAVNENLIRGNTELKVEGKVTSKGSVPLLLPHPGERRLCSV